VRKSTNTIKSNSGGWGLYLNHKVWDTVDVDPNFKLSLLVLPPFQRKTQHVWVKKSLLKAYERNGGFPHLSVVYVTDLGVYWLVDGLQRKSALDKLGVTHHRVFIYKMTAEEANKAFFILNHTKKVDPDHHVRNWVGPAGLLYRLYTGKDAVLAGRSQTLRPMTFIRAVLSGVMEVDSAAKMETITALENIDDHYHAEPRRFASRVEDIVEVIAKVFPTKMKVDAYLMTAIGYEFAEKGFPRSYEVIHKIVEHPRKYMSRREIQMVWPDTRANTQAVEGWRSLLSKNWAKQSL